MYEAGQSPIYTQETRSSYVAPREDHLHPLGTEPVLPIHRWRETRSAGGPAQAPGRRTPRRGPADPPVRDHDPPWGNPTTHGVTSRRASPPGRSSPTHWAQSLAQLPGEAGSGTHRRTARGNRPWGHRSVHGIRRGRSCSPSTQEPPVAQPRALNARLGMGGHR